MKKYFQILGLLAISLIGMGASTRANAQLVVACPLCNSELTQVLVYAKEIDQYLQMVQSYENEVAMYENMVKNTISLPAAYYDRAIQLVRNAEILLQGGTNISYASGNLNVQFGQMYPTYNTLLGQSTYATNQSQLQSYQQRSQQNYDGALTALQAAQAQSQAMSQEQSLMDSNGSLLWGAQGHLDAMQSAGVYMQNTAQQLMKMRQLSLIQIQLQAQSAANAQRQQDTDAAAFQAFLAPAIPDPVDTSITVP